MTLKKVRRMAATILKCGISRVWMDPTAIEELSTLITRNDVRVAIKGGAIKKKPIYATSRARANIIKIKKRKGRKSGQGTRKGGKYSIITRKERWIRQIRAIRDELKILKNSGAIDKHTYRLFYKRSKAGIIKSRAHLRLHLKVEGKLRGN